MGDSTVLQWESPVQIRMTVDTRTPAVSRTAWIAVDTGTTAVVRKVRTGALTKRTHFTVTDEGSEKELNVSLQQVFTMLRVYVRSIRHKKQ